MSGLFKVTWDTSCSGAVGPTNKKEFFEMSVVVVWEASEIGCRIGLEIVVVTVGDLYCLYSLL